MTKRRSCDTDGSIDIPRNPDWSGRRESNQRSQFVVVVGGPDPNDRLLFRSLGDLATVARQCECRGLRRGEVTRSWTWTIWRIGFTRLPTRCISGPRWDTPPFLAACDGHESKIAIPQFLRRAGIGNTPWRVRSVEALTF